MRSFFTEKSLYLCRNQVHPFKCQMTRSCSCPKAKLQASEIENKRVKLKSDKGQRNRRGLAGIGSLLLLGT